MANSRRRCLFEGDVRLCIVRSGLIREFKNYKWKEDQAGKATNEPIDKFNHGITFGELACGSVDAVRYVCLAKVIVNRKRMVKVGRV